MSWRAQGMRTWLLQRLTAVYMLLYLVGFGFYFYFVPVTDYLSWKAHFIHPFANLSTALFFFALLYHAWVGIRDILIDYISWSVLRFILWVCVSTVLIGLAGWLAMILYSVVQI